MEKIKLSPYSKTFYNEWLLYPTSTRYNILIGQKLYGHLDVSKLKLAIRRYINDHFILNSHIYKSKEDLYWVQNEYIQDLEYSEERATDESVNKFINQCFDLDSGPLYHFKLFREEAGSYKFIIVLHHIVIDGESADEGMFDALSKYYNDESYSINISMDEQKQLVANLSESLYAKIERSTPQADKFWHDKLFDVTPVNLKFLKIEGDPDMITGESGQIKFDFYEKQIEQLNQLKRKFLITPYLYSQSRLEIELISHKIAFEQEQKFRKIVNQVVHDIRSPLASIQMILPKCKKLPEIERLSLTKAATRIFDIANNLLMQYNPAKIEELKKSNLRKYVLVSSLVLELITEKRYEYNGEKVNFNIHVSESAYFAFLNISDSDFKRMLSNILNNVVEAYENKQGKVEVTLEILDNNVLQIVVGDNGCGMTDGVKDKILRHIQVTSGKSEGTGIGFSQIQDFLDDNDGTLDIVSQLNAGTKIILTFPLVAPPSWIAREIKLYHNDEIIILDDDESIHGAWDTKFRSYQEYILCKHFEQGDEAIKYINSLDVAAKEKIFLLTDYELLNQDLNGLEVVKQTGVKRAILVTSHHSEVSVRDEANLLDTKILPKFLASHIPVNVIPKQDSAISQLIKVDVVLLDDDTEYLDNVARFVAAKGKTVNKYNSIANFFNDLSNYAKDTKFFMDNHFKNQNKTGLDIANELHQMGFTKLYLFSGTDYYQNKLIPEYLTPILKTEIDDFVNILNS